MQRFQMNNLKTTSGNTWEKLPYGMIFLAGLIVGIVMMKLWKEVLLESSGLLNEDTLYHMKYMTVDNNALFRYVLRKRLGVVLIIGILSTTYLGLLVCVGTAFWYGMSLGAFLAALTARYGLKGIFFALAGIFPQYLLYAPAMAILLIWCEKINRSIYFKGYSPKEKDKYLLPVRMIRFLMVILLMVLGCILEAFCNPGIMLAFLKIF